MIGIIYELICNETKERYLGSTYDLTQRKRAHKCLITNTCISKQIIMRDNYSYNIIENYEHSELSQLRERENFYIQSLECINARGSFISTDVRKERKKVYDKTYKDKNYEKIQAHTKERYENSDKFKDIKNKPKQTKEEYKEKYNEWNIRIECECGGSTTKKHSKRHLKSLIHIKYVNKDGATSVEKEKED